MKYADLREKGERAAKDKFGITAPGGDIRSLQGDSRWQREWQGRLTIPTSSEKEMAK